MSNQTKRLFAEEKDPVKMKQLLEDNCDKKEPTEVEVHFTMEEKEDFKNEHSELSIQIHRENTKLKKARKAHKIATDDIKLRATELIEKLDKGSETRTEALYAIYDHQNNIVDYYNRHGELEKSRKMRPDEKQLKMAISKAG